MTGEASAAHCKRRRQKKLDLTQGPLLRAVLVRLVQTTPLILVMHHIVTDGWSIAVLFPRSDALLRGFQPG